MEGDAGRRRALSRLFPVLAAALAALAVWSVATLEGGLTRDRVLAQIDAMAVATARRAEAGVPIGDYTGFSADARALMTAEGRVAAIRIKGADGATVFEAPAPGAFAAAAAAPLADMVAAPIEWRFGAIGVAEAAFNRSNAPAPRGVLHPLAGAAAVVAAVIGLIYYRAIADGAALSGRRGAFGWIWCAAPFAAVVLAWLIAASGEAYREKARVASDMAAERLRAAVDMRLDPAAFSGLGGLLARANPALGGGPRVELALIEGRRVIARAGAAPAGAPGQVEEVPLSGASDDLATRRHGGFSLTAARTVRPGSLSAPSLTVAAGLSWRDVVLATPRDHPMATAALAVFLFVPALGVGLRRPPRKPEAAET